MLTCYIACSYIDRDLYARIEAVATGLGYAVTYRWPDHEPPSEGPDRHKHRQEQAVAEIEGVERADVLILGLPGRYGTASELGVALAAGTPVILVGALSRDPETGDPGNIFMDHPLVEHIADSDDELRADLRAIGDRVLADEMAQLIHRQTSAPYDSWSTSEHRANLERCLLAYNRLHRYAD